MELGLIAIGAGLAIGLAAIGTGLLIGVVVLAVAAAVLMATAGRPLLAAVRGPRAAGRQEVHGG